MMMKRNILILLIVTLAYSNHLCSSCIRITTLLQNSLIHVTPKFIVKDLVQSVCERECKKLSI